MAPGTPHTVPEAPCLALETSQMVAETLHMVPEAPSIPAGTPHRVPEASHLALGIHHMVLEEKPQLCFQEPFTRYQKL